MKQPKTELEEQSDLIWWADQHADPRLSLIYSHLNGVRVSPKTATEIKQSGGRKGIPDLFLPVPSQNYHGLYIELKRTAGGTVSADQRRWIAMLENQGYRAVVCKGAAAAKVVIEQYLGLA
jgi:hypothetical protein